MTAAETEEQAELEALRDQAGQTGREAARTLAELLSRLAEVNDPRAMGRRLAARARRRVRAAINRSAVNRSAVNRPAVKRPTVTVLPAGRAARRAAAAVVPVLVVFAFAIVAQRRGWLPPNSLIRNGRALRPRRLPSPGAWQRPARSVHKIGLPPVTAIRAPET